jgi:hypothetical protein
VEAFRGAERRRGVGGHSRLLGAEDERAHNLFQDLVTVSAKSKLFEKNLVGHDGDGEGAVLLQFGVDCGTVELV